MNRIRIGHRLNLGRSFVVDQQELRDALEEQPHATNGELSITSAPFQQLLTVICNTLIARVNGLKEMN